MTINASRQVKIVSATTCEAVNPTLMLEMGKRNCVPKRCVDFTHFEAASSGMPALTYGRGNALLQLVVMMLHRRCA